MRPLPFKVAIFATVLLMASTAMAAGGGGHGDEGHSPAAWLTLGFTFVNFSIFVLLMMRFTRIPLRDYLTARRQSLEEAIFAATKAKEEAEATRREYELKLAALEGTREQIIREMHETGEAERERVLAETREIATRLVEEASRTAESDLERARHELRAEAARLATDLARNDVEARITAADKSRLISEFVEAVQ